MACNKFGKVERRVDKAVQHATGVLMRRDELQNGTSIKS